MWRNNIFTPQDPHSFQRSTTTHNSQLAFWLASYLQLPTTLLTEAISNYTMWSCSAQTWRTKYSSTAAYDRVLKAQRVAVVMGATSGIGQACANRLAEQGFTVLAVGRDRPGRANQIIQMLKDHSAKTAKTTHEASSSSLSIPNHQFYPCDAFSLANIRDTAKLIQKDHPKIDALVMTQGMATLQGFTPTMDGNDEKYVAEANRKQKKYGIERPLANQYSRMIVSVNGDPDPSVISSFASSMPAFDSRFLRKAYKAVNPDVDMSFNFQCSHCGHEQGMEVPVTANFFWSE